MRIDITNIDGTNNDQSLLHAILVQPVEECIYEGTETVGMKGWFIIACLRQVAVATVDHSIRSSISIQQWKFTGARLHLVILPKFINHLEYIT